MSFICAVCLTGAALAQDQDPRRAQVTAATANAVANLRDQVGRAPISNQVTVNDFIARTNGEPALNRALQAAEQIGGPRWIDNQTCQVQLEISGARVADTLQQIAATNTDPTTRRPPISPDALRAGTAGWERRTFSATGASIGSADLTSLRPPALTGPWATVPEPARRQAIAAAKDNAVQHVVDSIRPIQLTPDQTIGDALRNEAVRRPIYDSLASRPVTRVDFRTDGQVEVALSAPPEELYGVLRSALSTAPNAPRPADDQAWARLREQLLRQASSATGLARPPAGAAAPVTLRLPEQPPEWAYQQTDTDGTASIGPSRLKATRAAESNALTKLRAQIEALPFSAPLTIGAAEAQDPRVSAAVQRALARARTYKVDYDTAARTVTVRVSLDLRDLWDELRMMQ
jgi:hypothetical protein